MEGILFMMNKEDNRVANDVKGEEREEIDSDFDSDDEAAENAICESL